MTLNNAEITIQTLAMPADTNANGDIFGGWLVSQMDLAAGVLAKKLSITFNCIPSILRKQYVSLFR